MTKRMILMLIAVTVVLGLVFGTKIFQGIMIGKFMKSMGAPPQTVSSIKATVEEWQPKLQAVGSLRAVNGADLSAELAGIVQNINFESGTDAEKDAVLIQLRADDEIAKLRALEATAKLAEITLDRDLKQLKTSAISQATVDNDRANLQSAKAQVAQQQAIVDKKTIKAPFAGRLGIRKVDVGQYINPGAVLVTLQQLDPIYVDFTLPEQAMTQIKAGLKVTASVDAYPDTKFEGEITSINSKVDEATRNIQARATFKNSEHKLLPGMYALVDIETGEAQRHITLPQTAISFNPYGSTVYLVEKGEGDKLQAKQAFVTTGLTRGDQIAVLTGVKEGDEVVTSGQLKLRNGAPIIINNEIQPLNDPNPRPRED